MTTNQLLWFDNGKFVIDDQGQMLLTEKPNLSFEFEFIKYNLNEQVLFLANSSTPVSLDQQQQQEIENFIVATRLRVGPPKFPGVDASGKYLGIVEQKDCHQVVTSSPPNADPHVYNFTKQQWERIYYFDAAGYETYDESLADGFTTKIPEKSAVYPFVSKWDKESDQWSMHDSKDIWPKFFLEKAALECVVDCIVLYLTNETMTPERSKVFLEAIFDNMIESDCDNSTKQLFNQYKSTMQQLYNDMTPKQMHNLIVSQKTTCLDKSLYNVRLEDLIKLDTFVKYNIPISPKPTP